MSQRMKKMIYVVWICLIGVGLMEFPMEVFAATVSVPSSSLMTRSWPLVVDFDVKMYDGNVAPVLTPYFGYTYGTAIVNDGGSNKMPSNPNFHHSSYFASNWVTVSKDGGDLYKYYQGIASNFAVKVGFTGSYDNGGGGNSPNFAGITSYSSQVRGYLFYFQNVPDYIREMSLNSSKIGYISQYNYEFWNHSGLVSNDNKNYSNPTLTYTGPGTFTFTGETLMTANESHSNPYYKTVPFAVLMGQPVHTANPGSPHLYWGKGTNSTDPNTRTTFFLKPYEIKETIVDDTGNTRTDVPSGYTQGLTTDAGAEQVTHNLQNLPASYVDGSGTTLYYQGWYRGATKPGTLNDPNTPPTQASIDYTTKTSIADRDQLGDLKFVYGLPKNFTLKEKYVDGTDSQLNSGAWDTSQAATQGSTFTGSPAATKTDTTGTQWEYDGWKNGLSGTVNNASVPVSVANIQGNEDIYYIYKKTTRTITQKWVDQADGSTLISVASNPKTTTMDDNDSLLFTPAASITDTSGNTWDYTGWENVTDAPGTINPTSTLVMLNNVKGNKEFRYRYAPRNTTASLDLNPTPQVTANGGTVSWTSRLTNTGASAMNNLTLKATTAWANGLSQPTQVTVTPAVGPSQTFVVNSGDWATGVTLTGVNIPSGTNNYADITFTNTATGAVNQVLPAEIEVSGNMASSVKADNFVRIDDPDEPNMQPGGTAGLINIPNFKFGQVDVRPFAQTKGLDAASYQASYAPYIRLLDQESTAGWSLTAKLGQFTSGVKTLPTATTITLKNGDLKEVQNYNKHNETLNSIGSVGTKVIPSDGTTVALTNGGTQGAYQLDYAFNDVELDLLAHTGIAGLSYTATMDWILTTAP
ncbi:WxL domain-containing protein [Enterococcus sp. DIV0187]|uniref:WxL domain-containing protein n=1 Tax=Enterococcus sp. DIV0187 TaxID=2774644 RepID=UPI003F23B9B5